MQVYYREQVSQRELHVRQEERKLVARELHDHVIQSLIGLKYNLANMHGQLGAGADVQIAQMQSHIHQVVDEVRRICANLRSPASKHVDLATLAYDYIQAVHCQGLFQVSYRFEGHDEQQLPGPVALSMLQVLQEALANVRKHAAARLVYVHLRICPDEVVLTIQDDGIGFTVPPALDDLLRAHHFGLIGLRERMDLLGGSLDVSAIPGAGTRVSACVQLFPVGCMQRISDEVRYE